VTPQGAAMPAGQEPAHPRGQAEGQGLDLAHFLPDPEAARALPRSVAVRYLVAPLGLEGEDIRVAMTDPGNLEALDYIEMVTGRHPVGVQVPEDQIRELIQRIYGASAAGPGELQSIVAEASRLAQENPEATELPVVRLVDQLLAEAVHVGATDIHLNPEERETVIRFRIDGLLRSVTRLPAIIHSPLVTRIKVMAGLDISERRLPQDGEIQLSLGQRRLDLRVSTIPTVFGENVVLRLLDHSRVLLGLADLGFLPEDVQRLDRLFHRPNGIILVTGPTGSGKTTTLYAALRTLDSEKLNIMTLEDPVEYQIPGIRQSQISEKAGFTFAAGLRSLMRQDPDVILVGEMRDQETAEIALRAALTGHLVFSTLHTTSAVGTIARLRDMGIKDYLLSATLVGILAQRLVRRVCASCHEMREALPGEKEFLGLDPDAEVRIPEAKGCANCHQTGYKGRFAIYELLEVSPTIARAISHRASQQELEELARREGLVSMKEMGGRRVLEGWTTIQEMARVVG
jgi:type IV pilus assembly protein PilB